ncbi:unnamed protein product, partial [Larinioides sclopetarius]
SSICLDRYLSLNVFSSFTLSTYIIFKEILELQILPTEGWKINLL